MARLQPWLVAVAAVAATAIGVWYLTDARRVREFPGEPSEPSARSLVARPAERDVRIAYQLLPNTGWEAIDELRLSVRRLQVEFIETEKGCDDDAYLSYLTQNPPSKKEHPPWPIRRGSGLTPIRPIAPHTLFQSDYVAKTLSLNHTEKVLALADLNRLPNGFIVNLRLVIDAADKRQGTTWTTVDVSKPYTTRGLRLTAEDGPVPVCERYITSIRFELAADQWLTGDSANPTLLADLADADDAKGELMGEATAPEAVFPDQTGHLEVPDGILVSVPRAAVPQAMVIRVKEMDWDTMPQKDEAPADGVLEFPLPKSHQSADPVFQRLMRRVGTAYDLKPDGYEFERPISIVLPVPRRYIVGEDTLERLSGNDFPPELAQCLARLNALFLSQAALVEDVRQCVRNELPPKHPLRDDLIEQLPLELEEAPFHPPDALALYTWSPAYRLWLPDVPRLRQEHHKPVLEELDRVIELERTSADSVEPDFSAIPQEAYRGLRLDFINNHVEGHDLVTETNHFCTKSLFADLNVGYRFDPATSSMVPTERYEPLLDGALDDMCQASGEFGFPRDSNEDVQCGGDPASKYDLRRRVRKTKRIIQEDGVALRFRDNVYDYFDARPACPASGSAAYCYDLGDFEDDVRWAINTWREAINRDPEGGWTDRFNISCWQTTSDAEGCSGREFDLGIKEISGDPLGRNLGRNVNLHETLLVDQAGQSEEGRLRLRSTLLHELGHAIGLDHWAGAGALMSYNGRTRRNDLRFNLCAPYSQAQTGSTAIPTDESEEFCRDPTSGNTWGNACTPQPITCVVDPVSGACTVDPPNTLNGTCTVDPVSGACTPRPNAGSCTVDLGSGRIDDFHSTRLNRLTCTDVQRIRQQVRDADTWTSSEPLRCEITADRSSYVAVEHQVYDAGAQQAYYTLELDLRFRHCGNAPAFDRMEFELLGVDANNDSNVVANLYKDPNNPPSFIVSTPLDPRDADDYYNVNLTLDSRNLAEPTTSFVADPATGNLVEVFPSFSDYIAGANLAGLDPSDNPIPLSYERLAMIIRTYVDTTTGGLISDYVAGSTGLLRAPFLDFIDEPFSIGMTDLRTGASRRGHALVGEYEDFAAADDWFPYIDSPIKKPNVGRVLYVVVPPPAADESYPNLFGATFEWTIPNQTYNAWAGSPQLLWVHSVEVTRGDVPTVGDADRLADWPMGTDVLLNAEGVMTRRHPGFFDPYDRDLWDPCRYLTDSFELDGTISAEPLHSIESPLDNPVEVWDLFRARIHYAYLGVGDANPGGPDPCPTSGSLCASGQLDPLCVVLPPQEPDRHIDFYFNIARPGAAIVHPPVDSLCRYNACSILSNAYTITANVKSVALLAALFPEYEFQVRIHGVGDPRDADTDPHVLTGGWIDIDDGLIDDEGNYSYTGYWLNNKDNSAYTVTLDYRHCVRTDSDPDCADAANWTESTMETLRLRFDKHCDCDNDSYDYQKLEDQCCKGECCGE